MKQKTLAQYVLELGWLAAMQHIHEVSLRNQRPEPAPRFVALVPDGAE